VDLKKSKFFKAFFSFFLAMKLSWDREVPQNFGPYRFSRFDVLFYKQREKQSLNIEGRLPLSYFNNKS